MHVEVCTHSAIVLMLCYNAYSADILPVVIQCSASLLSFSFVSTLVAHAPPGSIRSTSYRSRGHEGEVDVASVCHCLCLCQHWP